jgi:hypothetical protein
LWLADRTANIVKRDRLFRQVPFYSFGSALPTINYFDMATMMQQLGVG